MTQSGRTLFWLLSCASYLYGNADDTSYIRGVPGRDYPNYSIIPRTSFRCSKQLNIPGLYADPETRCQVFHHCYEHRQESFLCPLGTVFNQAILTCDYWYSADCSAAPLYHGSNSPHQASIYDTDPGFMTMKTSPDNLLDKMASLYEVNDDLAIPKDSGNEANSLEENHSFSDRDRPLINQSKPVIKNRNLIETTNHYDRHDTVLDELPEEYEYVYNKENIEDNIQYFEDSFEGSGQFSGESEEPDGELLSQGGYLWPSNAKRDFDSQQIAIMQEEHVEDKTKHDFLHYKDQPADPLTDFSHAFHSSSKGSSLPGETLSRRHSENNANPYGRKSMRRKPLFTVNESQAEITSFELSKDKVSTSSIDPNDQGTTSTTDSLSVSKFPDSSVTSYTAKRRLKPIMIDLDDSLQYNIDIPNHPDGGASVNYEVNSQSEVPGVSIAAQEISVKLIPNEANRKRKPVGEYFFNHYSREKEDKTESSTISYLTSPASNIHYETTNSLPTFNKEFEISDEDFAVNFNRINPSRKKNKIRIIDSDDNHVGLEDGEQEDTPFHMLQFEDEIVPQPIEGEFQTFEVHSNTFEDTKEIREQELMPEVSLKDGEIETDSSYFITDHNIVKLNNIIPDTHEILQETQDDGLDLPIYEEIQDETYFTAEAISDISTRIPLEIQNKEDSASKFYLVPQSDFESEYEQSGISKNTWRSAPVTLEGNIVRGQLELDSIDLNPAFHIFLEDSIGDGTTEQPHSEDVELQTIISDSYEKDAEMEHLPSTELTEIILYNKTSVSSTPKDIANNNYTDSGEMSTASDILLDTEHQYHLPNSNSDLNSTTKLDVIVIESKHIEDTTQKDITANQSLEIQRYLVGESVHFDAMKKRDEDVKDQTALLELNTNSPQLKNIQHKGNAESEDAQEVIDLSKDFSETSNQFESFPPVTTNSILETSENPQFWNHIKAFQNGAFNYNPKLTKNVGMKADLSQVFDDQLLKTTVKPIIYKAHTVSLPTDQGSIKTRPLRSARSLTSPYQMSFNMVPFDSQYLAGFPSSVLKLKQSNIQKFLPYSGHAFEDGDFYARTGSLLESPKISKLISFGKNLLRSKRAKYRILSRYVNSFKSNS